MRARRKGDRQKVRLARELRAETTVSLKWIAQRLEMGSWTYVSNLLRQAGQEFFVSKVRTDPFSPRRISVPADRWVAFRRHLDSAKVWSWRQQYIDLAVVDGTSWRLQVAYRERRITSRGSNAYPPKRQFEEFRAAVQELTGGRRFE